MNLKIEFSPVNIFLLVIFFIGLIYLLLPGPSSISDFPPLVGSTRSNLEGDTIQNPNIEAFFSDFRRDYITHFYFQILSTKLVPAIKIPPLKLNHPPEEAFRYVRDQQESTFLEEYTYPLRETLFVNGYDPSVQNVMFNHLTDFVGNHLSYEDQYYNTKTTLRFYPSNPFARIIVYFCIWLSFIGLFILFRRVQKQV